jgi:hypothetical protein
MGDRALALTLGLAAVLAGCLDAEDRCDPGHVLDRFGCVQAAAATPIPGGSPAPPSSATPGASATPGDAVPGLGRSCGGDADCAGSPADYCARMPGSSRGLCAIDGCTLVPDDCPPGMFCFDPSSLVPDLPTLCVVEGAL